MRRRQRGGRQAAWPVCPRRGLRGSVRLRRVAVWSYNTVCQIHGTTIVCRDVISNEPSGASCSIGGRETKLSAGDTSRSRSLSLLLMPAVLDDSGIFLGLRRPLDRPRGAPLPLPLGCSPSSMDSPSSSFAFFAMNSLRCSVMLSPHARSSGGSTFSWEACCSESMTRGGI